VNLSRRSLNHKEICPLNAPEDAQKMNHFLLYSNLYFLLLRVLFSLSSPPVAHGCTLVCRAWSRSRRAGPPLRARPREPTNPRTGACTQTQLSAKRSSSVVHRRQRPWRGTTRRIHTTSPQPPKIRAPACCHGSGSTTCVPLGESITLRPTSSVVSALRAVVCAHPVSRSPYLISPDNFIWGQLFCCFL
jgi:hypothetical protein